MKINARLSKLERQVEKKYRPEQKHQFVTLKEQNGKRYNMDGTEWVEPQDGIDRTFFILRGLT